MLDIQEAILLIFTICAAAYGMNWLYKAGQARSLTTNPLPPTERGIPELLIPEQQAQVDLYDKFMKKYLLSDKFEANCDYYLILFQVRNSTDGKSSLMRYYAPNPVKGNNLHVIVAVDTNAKLALKTGFIEVASLSDSESRYAIVNDNGLLRHRFEVNDLAKRNSNKL